MFYYIDSYHAGTSKMSKIPSVKINDIAIIIILLKVLPEQIHPREKRNHKH